MRRPLLYVSECADLYTSHTGATRAAGGWWNGLGSVSAAVALTRADARRMKIEPKMAKSRTAAMPNCQGARRRGRGTPKGVIDCRNFRRETGSSMRLANHSTH